MPTPEAARMRALTAAFLAVLCVAMAVALLGIGYVAYQGAKQSKANGKLIEQTAALNARILDCTEAGGKCYEEGGKRTAEAVVGINEGTMKVIVAALSCQDDGFTEQKVLLECTVQRAQDSGGD